MHLLEGTVEVVRNTCFTLNPPCDKPQVYKLTSVAAAAAAALHSIPEMAAAAAAICCAGLTNIQNCDRICCAEGERYPTP